MKKFLENLLAKRKQELKEKEERMKGSNDINEVRALGETLIALRDEINDVESQLAALETEPETESEEGRGLDPIASYGMKNKPEERKVENDPRGTMEYRQAFMNYAKNGTLNPVLQMRADDQTESGDLGVLLPTTVVQEIIKGAEKVYGQLYSRVKKTNLKGGVKYPIGSFAATFKRISENGAPTDRQNGGSITGYVEFTYKLGEVRLAQTLLANVLSVPVFEAELAKVIVECYVKAMDIEIMKGGDVVLFPTESTNQCEGILTEAAKGGAGRIPTANIITFTAADMEDWKSWQKKLFSKIPLSMRSERPEFVMTANTYESNIKTLKDDNNRPVYAETYNPVDGAEKATFKGREVIFVENDILKDFDDAAADDYFGMLWVPEKAYAINTNLEFAVKRYFDEEKLQYVDRAVVINDGKILDPKYIYLLKKGA